MIQAAQNHVFPLLSKQGDSTNGARLERAGASWVYRGIHWPFTIPEDAGLNVERRSYELHARITRPKGTEGGVVFSQGDRTGGFAFYVREGHLKFAYNDNVAVYTVASDVEVPSGVVEVGYRYEREDPSVYHATVTLELDGRAVGTLELPHLYTFTAWDAVIRANPYTPVTEEYEAPFEFQGDILELRIEQDAVASAYGPGETDHDRRAAAHVD